MLVHIKELVRDAQKRGYTIGAFNVHNFETIVGVIRAAAKAKSPVIIQVSEGTIAYLGLNEFVAMVKSVSDSYKVKTAIHIDHGKSFESVMACVKAGFTSIHIDGSSLPIDENIRLTNKVMKAVAGKNVWVQGEVGPIMGGHGVVGGKIKDVPIADLDEVVRFVKETKVDTIAAAIGTAHGAFTNEKIIFDLLKKIKKATNGKTFVLHGGSGLPDKDVRRAMKDGVNIINIGTDIKAAFSQTLIASCIKNKKETDPRPLLRPTIDAVEAVALGKMKLFGSCGRVK